MQLVWTEGVCQEKKQYKYISLFGGFLQIFMPHKNLGCLGISIAGRYLGDLFQSRHWGRNGNHAYGLYWRFGGFRHYFSFNSFKYRKID